MGRASPASCWSFSPIMPGPGRNSDRWNLMVLISGTGNILPLAVTDIADQDPD